MIAALFVEKNGVYFDLPGVDPWDEQRDALLYQGPHPVVAHPPCTRWCRLAGLVEARYGYKKGEDGGLFEFALNAVRQHGGILEHPAYSAAWSKYDLPVPSRYGGWQKGFCGGWSCQVEQGRYGHPAKKATWLYAYGTELPSLRWGFENDSAGKSLVSWYGYETKMVSRLWTKDPRGNYDNRPRLSSKKARETPIEFRDALIDLAKSAYQRKIKSI